MSTEALVVIDIDAMVAPVAEIVVQKKKHKVLPVNGASYEMLQEIATLKDKSTYLGISQQIVAQVVPTLTQPQVKALHLSQLSGIIALATGQVEKVRKMTKALEGNGHSSTSRKRRRPKG